MRSYLVLEIGCLCCASTTSMVGIYDNESDAEAHLRRALRDTHQSSDIDFEGGQGKFVVQMISKLGNLSDSVPKFMTSELKEVRNLSKENQVLWSSAKATEKKRIRECERDPLNSELKTKRVYSKYGGF